MHWTLLNREVTFIFSISYRLGTRWSPTVVDMRSSSSRPGTLTFCWSPNPLLCAPRLGLASLELCLPTPWGSSGSTLGGRGVRLRQKEGGRGGKGGTGRSNAAAGHPIGEAEAEAGPHRLHLWVTRLLGFLAVWSFSGNKSAGGWPGVARMFRAIKGKASSESEQICVVF